MDAGDQPEYPIVPKASENHDYVMVLVDNDIDMAYLETLFDLKINISYKNSNTGLGRVITIDHFRECIKDKLNANYEIKRGK